VSLSLLAPGGNARIGLVQERDLDACDRLATERAWGSRWILRCVTISLMNWDQMKKNVHARVQLKPAPHRLDDYGRKLPPLADDWIVEEVSADGVRIKNLRTDRTTTLGKDHIYDYVSNPDQSHRGVKHGFLTLKVQIFLKPKGLSIIPTARPGEPVEPPAVEIREQWVSEDYPSRSGLKARLEAAGYSVTWAWDTKLGDLALKGWEIVIEPDAQGVLTKFRFDEVGPHQTLVKRKG